MQPRHPLLCCCCCSRGDALTTDSWIMNRQLQGLSNWLPKLKTKRDIVTSCIWTDRPAAAAGRPVTLRWGRSNHCNGHRWISACAYCAYSNAARLKSRPVRMLLQRQCDCRLRRASWRAFSIWRPRLYGGTWDSLHCERFFEKAHIIHRSK